MTTRSILVIAPHGLDEVLGCGGTMALHADAGDIVNTLILFGDGTGHDAERQMSAGQAAAVLGSNAPCFAGFPENRSDTVPLSDMIGAVERQIAELKPDTLYVSHDGNLNIDHQNAFRAVVTAARPVAGSSVRMVLAYEIRSSTDWAPGEGGFSPTVYRDITSVEARKLEALSVYRQDMRDPPHSRSLDGIRAHHVARGSTVGLGAAEAFRLIRMIWGSEPAVP